MSEEEKIRGLETKVESLANLVTDLRLSHERSLISTQHLQNANEHLAGLVEELTRVVQDLRDTMNKGRGALWLAMSAAGGLGAFSVVILRRVFGAE